MTPTSVQLVRPYVDKLMHSVYSPVTYLHELLEVHSMPYHVPFKHGLGADN